MLLLLATTITSAGAQTFKEFFRQKKTQREYLAKQIAALKMYSTYLREGYEIARDGLSLAGDITSGEFSLHKNYFGSLSEISPVVRGSADVIKIIALQKEVVEVLSGVSESKFLHPSDKKYIENVRKGMLKASLDDLDQLLLLISAGVMELSDGQRLERLKNVLYNIRRKATLARELSTHVQALILQRKREANAVDALGEIYRTNR